MVKDKASAVAQEILYSGKHLPQMPEHGPELLKMARQPLEQIDVERLTALIEADPGMTARLLRLANSAYYRTVNKISTLNQAIMHIGLEETLSTACYLFYKNAIPKFPKLPGFSDREYWSHSWSCANAAKMLGHPQLMIGTLPGELYIAGLLHGIGKLMLALHKPDLFLLSIDKSRETNRSIALTELEILGTNDGYVASAVLGAWRFPETICMAVKHYYDPAEAPEEHREIAAVTQFAYYIANISGIGGVGDQFYIDPARTWIVQQSSLPLSRAAVRETHVAQILTTLSRKSEIFNEKESTVEGGKNKSSGRGGDIGAGSGRKTPKSASRPRKPGPLSRLLNFLRRLFS